MQGRALHADELGCSRDVAAKAADLRHQVFAVIGGQLEREIAEEKYLPALEQLAPGARAEVMKWTIDGVERQALVLAPSKAALGGAKAPVVTSLKIWPKFSACVGRLPVRHS